MATRIPESSALQVYQRLLAAGLDDAARELTRRQFEDLVSGVVLRAKRVHNVGALRLAA